MSKTSNNAKFAALIPWLEDLKKNKPKRVLKNNDTEEKAVLVRDNSFKRFKRK
jgi:hypothetical protein